MSLSFSNVYPGGADAGMRKLTYKKIILYFCVLVYLGISNVMIKLVPFAKLVRIVSNSEKTTHVVLTNKMMSRINSIKHAVYSISPITPWRSKCFEQALTASFFLKICGISHTIHFGLNNDNSDLKAHAWLTVNEIYVTGFLVGIDFVDVFQFYHLSKKDRVENV